MRKGYHRTDEQRARRLAMHLSPSPETRAKMSAAKKGKPNHHKGHPCSESTRAKMSAARIGNTNRRGSHASDETRAKMSAARKGRPFSDEHKARISESLRGEQNPVWKGGPRAKEARRWAKRRLLGYVYLNAPFPDSEGHHVDNEQVINLPKALHQGIRHCLHTGKNMAKINAIAYNFLFKQEVEAALEALEANVA